MFLYTFHFGPLETTTILLGCEQTKKAAVIDPAFQSTETLLIQAKKHDLTIEKILLTHSHWDHFADAFALKEKTRAPLFVHSLDEKNLREPGVDGVPLFIPIHPVIPNHLIQEGEIISVGNLKVQVIHTPGHSPGGVCFYLAKENLLLSGDTLFKRSIGNLSLSTGNAEQMWQSLKKLAKLPKNTRVIPGHGEETTIGQENWLERAEQIF